MLEIGTLKAVNVRETERCLKEVNCNADLKKQIDDLNGTIKQLQVKTFTMRLRTIPFEKRGWVAKLLPPPDLNLYCVHSPGKAGDPVAMKETEGFSFLPFDQWPPHLFGTPIGTWLAIVEKHNKLLTYLVAATTTSATEL